MSSHIHCLGIKWITFTSTHVYALFTRSLSTVANLHFAYLKARHLTRRREFRPLRIPTIYPKTHLNIIFPPLPWIFKQPLYKRVSSPKFYVNCLRPLSPFVSPRYKANVFYRHFLNSNSIKAFVRIYFLRHACCKPCPFCPDCVYVGCTIQHVGDVRVSLPPEAMQSDSFIVYLPTRI